jgi:uncharacterized LabA/DUF88 family protein
LNLNNLRLAVLIDAENVPRNSIKSVMEEVAIYGTPTIKRIYGDWTNPSIGGWKMSLLENAITPIQQYSYTTGKNSSDSAMIIDAMDILFTAGIDGFCLVSSDSDYTRLATRIREKNLFVMGIGKESTPRPFVDACNVFVYTENLIPPVEEPNESAAKPATDPASGKVRTSKDTRALKKLLTAAFELAVQDDGWATLAAMGNFLRQLDPGFDPRTYGHKQLLQLVEAHPRLIEVKKVQSSGNTTVCYVRMKGKH